MRRFHTARQGLVLLLLLGLGTLLTPDATPAQDKPKDAAGAFKDYMSVITQTAGMVDDREASRLARAKGLDILNITWEDTGRFHNSAVGPNISDMTIQVQQIDPNTQSARLTCMPVIRFPNFSDKTADVDIKKFQVLVGNEKKGDELRPISLMRYLGNFRKYLTKPDSWKGDETYLLAERDTHVLVSAQACFLPVPKQGIAEFNPVLFNYQSGPGDPAVLAILVTREGTSATIIDNHRDGFTAPRGVWGQRLFHNKLGERCSLTGQRLSDFTPEPGPMPNPTDPKPPLPNVGKEASLNLVMLIQVPLKQKPRPEPGPISKPTVPADKDKGGDKDGGKDKERRSDVEAAVIGHGKVEGPFTEIDNLPIQRDPRFPVRVTVQFYKATSNGVVSPKDIDDIKKDIDRVYAEGDFVGSLVVGPQVGRPTEYDGDKVEPVDWWQNFWQDYRQRTGLNRVEVLAKLREQKGAAWVPLTEDTLRIDAEEFARTWVPPAWWNRPLTWGLAGGAAVALLAAVWLVSRRRPAVGTA
jgi:hypothetical protein